MKIFNASPLILLLDHIDEPGLLKSFKSLDGVLLVPKRVIQEIKSLKAKKNLEELIELGILESCENCKDETSNYISNRFPGLDDGELTVLSLVYEHKRKDCIAIIDEFRGRSVALSLGLSLKGAFGLILDLYKTHKIDLIELKRICRKIDKSQFRIDFKGLGYSWVTE